MGYFLFAFIYLICSVLTYGLSFAYFQGEYPTIAKEMYEEDLFDSFKMALLGPFGLAVVVVMSGTKHGLKFK